MYNSKRFLYNTIKLMIVLFMEKKTHFISHIIEFNASD